MESTGESPGTPAGAARGGMETRIAVLADYTSVTAEGKLNVLGTFTRITSHDVPAMHPSMVVVWQLEYVGDEAGEYDVEIEFVDADGETLQKISGPMMFPEHKPGVTATQNILFGFVNLVLPKFGLYEFRLRQGPDTKARIRLEVVKVE